MSEKYRVHEFVKFRYSDIGEYIDEYHTDRPLRNDILVNLLNEQDKTIKELEREKKSFMDDAIKFEKECKRLYNNLRLTNSDLYFEKLEHINCKKENKRLTEENCQLKREKERYKRLSEIRAENINNRILSLREFINNCEDEKVKNALEDLFYLEVKEYDLAKENRELKAEKEFWKGDACNCSNYLSILSMDCQIVQEAICDLKSVIDVDTEASKLLDELDDKFDELNQHRIKMYSR